MRLSLSLKGVMVGVESSQLEVGGRSSDVVPKIRGCFSETDLT